jgi:hypothetical protein
MLADLDLLLIAVFCTADDLLPEKPKNARRRVTDAEVVTLCVAQAVMDVASDREFLAIARKRLSHLFPELPAQPGYLKRRRRLAETVDWLTAVFASDCPGGRDPIVLLDSTPVECGRSVETARRSELADACGYGYCRSHSRWFWGMRLHLACAPDGTPRAAILAPADQKEREVALRLLPIALRGGEALVCDKGYAGSESSRRWLSASVPGCCAQAAQMSPTTGFTSRASASSWSRSSGHSRTGSGWSAIGPARSPASAPAWPANCWHWPPASGSTTYSVGPPAHSPS